MMDNREIEERLMNIEIALANQERITDDLNQVIIPGRCLTFAKAESAVA